MLLEEFMSLVDYVKFRLLEKVVQQTCFIISYIDFALANFHGQDVVHVPLFASTK